MSWIYIVAVIIFAIVSNVNKAAKNKPKGRMPSFGGGEDDPLRRNRPSERDVERPEGTGSGFPSPAPASSRSLMSEENREYDASPAFPEPAYIPTPDYSTGEGMSLEHADDGVELRTQRMQEEVKRLQSAFDRIPGADSPSSYKTKRASQAEAVQSNGTGNRNDLRNGVVWAEILGPPRARNPHSTRR